MAVIFFTTASNLKHLWFNHHRGRVIDDMNQDEVDQHFMPLSKYVEGHVGQVFFYPTFYYQVLSVLTGQVFWGGFPASLQSLLLMIFRMKSNAQPRPECKYTLEVRVKNHKLRWILPNDVCTVCEPEFSTNTF